VKPKHYHCELYRLHFYFLIGWPQEKAERFFQNKFSYHVDLSRGDGYTILFQNGKTSVVIWTRLKNDMGVLAHEATHAASFTLGRAGVKASFDNDEAHAYLVGLLTEKALEKKTCKNKKK
jgi:hypothetical protein